jgi:hypothetical protein
VAPAGPGARAAETSATSRAGRVRAACRPGVTLSAANAELRRGGRRINAAQGSHGGLRAIWLHDREGRNETGHVAVLTLALAVLLLVIACMNLAGVQVARWWRAATSTPSGWRWEPAGPDWCATPWWRACW